jgi:hypothetical protein
MKKFLLQPSFEFIFSISILCIFALPPMVLAQTPKKMEIEIINGDTTINGKNIKELTPKEKQDALNDMKNINGKTFNYELKTDGEARKNVIIKKRGNVDGDRIIIEKSDDMPMIADRSMEFKDSTGKTFHFKMKTLEDDNEELAFNNDEELSGLMKRRGPRMKMMMNFNDSRNSQNFSYTNTDNNGISTSASYNVSEPSKETLKKNAGIEKGALEIKDLNIVPEFSSGKTVISFNLPAKGTAEVQFKDSEGKVLWSDRSTTGSFRTAFTLGLNGIYYLQVSQAGKTVLKRIVKE